MSTTLSSIVTKRKKQKRKKLPSLKLSFDFENNIPGVQSVSSIYYTNEGGYSPSRSRLKYDPLSSKNRAHKMSFAQSDKSMTYYMGNTNTTTNFYKPPKPNAKLRPISGNIQKPPLGGMSLKH